MTLSKCPHMASFLPVRPLGTLTRLIDSAVREMLQSPFLSPHIRTFILPLKHSLDHSTAAELLLSPLTIPVAPRNSM